MGLEESNQWGLKKVINGAEFFRQLGLKHNESLTVLSQYSYSECNSILGKEDKHTSIWSKVHKCLQVKCYHLLSRPNRPRPKLVALHIDPPSYFVLCTPPVGPGKDALSGLEYLYVCLLCQECSCILNTYTDLIQLSSHYASSPIVEKKICPID